MGVPPVGTLGSFINPDDGLTTRHRFALTCATVLIFYTVQVTLRSCVPALAKRYPLRAKHNMTDVATLWASVATVFGIYLAKVDINEPRFEENFILRNRVSLAAAIVAACTVIYYTFLWKVFAFMPEATRPAQASNVVRLTVKLVCLSYWVLSGDFLEAALTHPLELTDAKYQSAHMVMHALGSMYLWELLFRDLRPVNVIHHAITCAGCCSTLEWQCVVQPLRLMIVVPMMGALTESVCCLGTMAYRFLPRGRMLQRLMIAEVAFVVIVYNALQVGYFMYYMSYVDMMSTGWKITMPLLSVFTYPAQMNMGRVFWALSKKAGRPEVPQAAAQPAEEPIKRSIKPSTFEAEATAVSSKLLTRRVNQKTGLSVEVESVPRTAQI